MAVGLDGFGKPDGYLARQVRRWKGQLELTEPLTRRVEDMSQELALFRATMSPTSRPKE